MRRLDITKSRPVLAVLALTILVISLCVFSTRRSAGIPEAVAIRGEMTSSEAESLYRSSDKSLRGLYWRRVRAKLASGHFRQFWFDLKRGPERIHALSKESDGFVVSATNRLGESCTIRCPRPSVAQPNGPWKVVNLLPQLVRIPAPPDGAANGSQPIPSQTNSTSEAADSRR